MVNKKIRKLVKEAQNKRRRFVREFNTKVQKRNRGKITCASCEHPWCCYQLVAAGLFEGAIIADHLMRTKQEELFVAAAQQGTEQFELMADLPLDDAEGRSLVSEQWFDSRQPCAFLKEGRCSIYQQRPLTCSCYWVISPAADCGPPSGKDIWAVNHTAPVGWGISLDSAFAKAVLGEDDLVAQMPLGYAVRLGFRLLTEGGRSLKRETR